MVWLKTQPTPADGPRGVIECDWAESFRVPIRADWLSGVYLGKLSTLPALMALVTNGPAATQHAKIERFTLAALFDHIQIEGEAGALLGGHGRRGSGGDGAKGTPRIGT